MSKMTFAALLATAALSAAPALAQETPGTTPIEPYTQSNANAGATPFAGGELVAAFHGKEGIARIVDEMVRLNTTDPRIGELFKTTDLDRLRRTLREQIGYLLGTGEDYTGRDMTASHKNQGINTAEFNIVVQNLQKAMDKEGVAVSAQNKLLYKMAPMYRQMRER